VTDFRTFRLFNTILRPLQTFSFVSRTHLDHHITAKRIQILASLLWQGSLMLLSTNNVVSYLAIP